MKAREWGRAAGVGERIGEGESTAAPRGRGVGGDDAKRRSVGPTSIQILPRRPPQSQSSEVHAVAFDNPSYTRRAGRRHENERGDAYLCKMAFLNMSAAVEGLAGWPSGPAAAMELVLRRNQLPDGWAAVGLAGTLVGTEATIVDSVGSALEDLVARCPTRRGGGLRVGANCSGVPRWSDAGRVVSGD